MDRVATRTDPLSRQESFAFDLNGQLTTRTDRKGQVTSHTYDALGRRTFTGFDTTGTPPTYASTVATTYDAGDRATEIIDSSAGTITRTYDLSDRLTQEETPEGTIDYTYDDVGRRITMTVSGQTAVSYDYDNANRLTGVTQGTAVVTLAYDSANRRTSLTLPNGVATEYEYDSVSQLTGLTYKLSGTPFGDLGYAYDANGQRTAVTGSYARSGLPSALTSATYDDANQIATFGGTTFSYDANGNLTSDGSSSYTWTARNQLTGMSGSLAASFEYDGTGRRRSKTINGTTTNFLYDGPNFVQELSSNGTPLANLLTGLGTDETFMRTDANGSSSLLGDGLGSTIALADSVGSIQTTYTFEPFGATTSSGVTSANAAQFTGRENDGTGLYYYRARYYSPRVGQFTSEDPLGFAEPGTNLRAYVSNRPTVLVDPFGFAGQYPEPTNPDGRLRPPPIPVPGPPGNEWVPLDKDPKTGRRPWKPKEPCPSPKGEQPRPQWDPNGNHWDYDDGTGGERQHFLPDGTRVDHWNNPIERRTFRPPTPAEVLHMTIVVGGTLLLIGGMLIFVF
jgi:RHS repeat-associated protein